MWLTKDSWGYTLFKVEPQWDEEKNWWISHFPSDGMNTLHWITPEFEKLYPHRKMRAGKNAIVEVDIEIRRKK